MDNRKNQQNNRFGGGAPYSRQPARQVRVPQRNTNTYNSDRDRDYRLYNEYFNASQVPIYGAKKADLRAVAEKQRQSIERTKRKTETKKQADHLRTRLSSDTANGNVSERLRTGMTSNGNTVYRGGANMSDTAHTSRPEGQNRRTPGRTANGVNTERASYRPQSYTPRVPKGEPEYTASGVYYHDTYYSPRRNSPSREELLRRREYERRVREAERQRIEEEKKRNKRRRKLYYKLFFRRFVIFLIIVSLFTFLRYNSVFNSSGDGGSDAEYRLVSEREIRKTDKEGKEYKETERKVLDLYTAGSSVSYHNGVLYLNFSRTAEWLGLASVGSIGTMRFIIPGADTGDSAGTGREEYIIFTENSRMADINGNSVVLEAECRVIANEIWVPVSFVENYLNGVQLRVMREDSVFEMLYPWQDGEDEADEEADGLTVTFSLSRSAPIDSVTYPES